VVEADEGEMAAVAARRMTATLATAEGGEVMDETETRAGERTVFGWGKRFESSHEKMTSA
jgi:hypothetical protein